MTDEQTNPTAELANAKKAELQKLAEELGLDTKGTKAELRARIEEHHAAQAEEDDEELTVGQRMARQLRNARERYQPSVAYSGNKSMHNGDDLAQMLEGCSPAEVVQTAEALLEIPGELWAKYERLNPGQQRMNAGNRIRAMVKRGDATTDDVAKAIANLPTEGETMGDDAEPSIEGDEWAEAAREE